MLNRRTLRIKIMQTLFAFDQCREANYGLAFEQLDEEFKPDLNSMEVQDKELLKGQRKSARQLLEKRFNNPSTADTAEARVNSAVKTAMSDYQKQVKKDFQFFSKHMVQEVEKINGLYHSVLGLLVSFADYAASDKRANYKNYIDNSWVVALRSNVELKKEIQKSIVRPEKARGWFNDIVRSDEEFIRYDQLRSPSADDQRAIIKHLSRKVILGKGTINSHFEEDDIHWTEDQEIVRSLVDKTIKSLDDSGHITLQKLSLDWDDDKEFMTRLFKDAAELDEKYKKLIASNTKNWEVDRLPLTDRIILEMAIAELVTFSHIPVKVTINEYIELAKLYSTPKSRQFINGILDVIAKELVNLGAIKKSGRGLIDNK